MIRNNKINSFNSLNDRDTILLIKYKFYFCNMILIIYNFTWIQDKN